MNLSQRKTVGVFSFTTRGPAKAGNSSPILCRKSTMSQKLKLREAISSIFQDFLKDGIKALVKFMVSGVLNIYGASIVLLILSFLLGLLPWLQIPIKIPVFVFVTFIGFVVVAIPLYRKLEANRRIRKLKQVVLGGLLYKSDLDGTVTGPLCTRCKAKMIMVFDQDENVTRVVFGKDAIYKYICTSGHEVVSNKPSTEFLKEALDHFYKEKSAA